MAKTNYDGPILEIDELSISFFTRLREIPAVMDFSVTVQPGEAVGLVGESGCGKSTVALGVMQDLGKNGKIVGGSIKFKGRDLGAMSDEELRDIRGSEIAMIYQEPMASLNPAMKIGKQLMEVPMIHQGMAEKDAFDLGLAFERHALNAADDEVDIPFRFSSELSGKKVVIRCAFSGLEAGDIIEVKLNDTLLELTANTTAQSESHASSIPTTIYEGNLSSPSLLIGENTLHLKLVKACSSRKAPIKAGEFEINVRSLA